MVLKPVTLKKVSKRTLKTIGIDNNDDHLSFFPGTPVITVGWLFPGDSQVVGSAVNAVTLRKAGGCSHFQGRCINKRKLLFPM